MPVKKVQRAPPVLLAGSNEANEGCLANQQFHGAHRGGLSTCCFLDPACLMLIPEESLMVEWNEVKCFLPSLQQVTGTRASPPAVSRRLTSDISEDILHGSH